MKKIIFAFSLNIFVLSSFGQQNPIQNLQATAWYITPYNCFTLTWDAPLPSATDTLIGYNVYRNDSLYAFTTTNGIQCVPCIGDTNSTYCMFMSYQSFFYTHVTAVYNTLNVESTYNDSIYFPGVLATGINEISKNEITLSQTMPNPANDYTYINYSLSKGEKATLTVYNCFGQIVLSENVDVNAKNHRLNTSNLAQGVYYYNISSGNSSSGSLRLSIVR